MRSSRRISYSLLFTSVLLLSGCGYVHVGKMPAPVTTVIGDEKLMKENADLKLEKKILQQELALTRAQGDALRMAIENRAADGDTSTRMVEKLNETSRELATLRANYAKLQTERNQAVTSAAEAGALRLKLGATEEKLAASLHTYTELQGEISRLRTDVERSRTENVALGEQVKTITAQNDQAQAALAQLNTDLLFQKDARLRAEQDAQTLRTELTTAAPNASALAQQRTGAAAAASSLIAEHAAETAALKQQLDALRTKVETLTTERTQLKQQLGGDTEPHAPSPELANVEAKLASALRNASLLRDENEQLKTTSTQLSATKAELEGQLSQLKNGAPPAAQVQTLREQLRDAQAQAATLTDENSRLKTRIASTPTTVTPPAARINLSGVNATLTTNVPGSASSSSSMVRSETSGPTRFHVVAGGDTLAKISNQYYGTPGRWGDILAANRDILGESNNLVVGRTLRIP